MNRQEINRIVAQKFQTNAAGKTFCVPQRIGCVPCFGAASRKQLPAAGAKK